MVNVYGVCFFFVGLCFFFSYSEVCVFLFLLDEVVIVMSFDGFVWDLLFLIVEGDGISFEIV